MVIYFYRLSAFKVTTKVSTFVFFNYMPKRGIAGSYDSSIFSFSKNFYTVFQSDCPSLHSHQQCIVPFLHILTNICICRLFDDSHLTGVKCYLLVVLTCVSLMISKVEHLFMCQLALSMFSLERKDIQVFCRVNDDILLHSKESQNLVNLIS